MIDCRPLHVDTMDSGSTWQSLVPRPAVALGHFPNVGKPYPAPGPVKDIELGAGLDTVSRAQSESDLQAPVYWPHQVDLGSSFLCQTMINPVGEHVDHQKVARAHAAKRNISHQGDTLMALWMKEVELC